MLGTAISEVEVSFASTKGFWILLGQEELFVSFDEFPWFRKATIEQLVAVVAPGVVPVDGAGAPPPAAPGGGARTPR